METQVYARSLQEGVSLETFLSGMETRTDNSPISFQIFTLKPSLVEWKPQTLLIKGSQALFLETFLSGMETRRDSGALQIQRPP